MSKKLYSDSEGDPISLNIQTEEEVQYLYDRSEPRRLGNSSSFFASYNVICTVVGTGLLQLPFGMEETGWVGIFILVGLAIVAAYTAILLIKCMNPPSGNKLYTYSEIGKEAFGVYGSIIVDLMLHATLIGVATIYLILSGGNLYTLLTEFPSYSDSANNSTYSMSLIVIPTFVCILICACIMWWHVWLKTLHEVGFMSAFNVLVAIFLLIVVLLEIFTNIPNPLPKHAVISNSVLSLAGGFVSFAFSYGAHAVLPTVYETMKKPEQFNKMIILTFIGILMFYLPMSVSGYYAFGECTVSPIYNNICNNQCTFPQSVGKWLAVAAITIHIMMSYAIVLNPTERAIERLLHIDEMENKKISKILSVAIRTDVVLLTVFIASIIPDFGDFLNLVSSVTNTSTTFIFPCLFHLVLFRKSLRGNYLVIGINICIILFTAITGVFGAVGAINGILKNVFNLTISFLNPATSTPPDCFGLIPT